MFDYYGTGKLPWCRQMRKDMLSGLVEMETPLLVLPGATLLLQNKLTNFP